MGALRGAAGPLALLVLLTGLAGCGTEERPYTPLGSAETAAGPSARAGDRDTGREPADPDSGEAGTPSARPRPVTRFPGGFKVVFEAAPPAAGHPAVQRFEEFWRAWWYAVATSGRDTRYRSYLTTESFLRGTRLFHDLLRSWREEQVGPIGTARVYDVEVSEKDGAVLITACGDETGVGTRNLLTGKRRWTFGKQPGSIFAIYLSMTRVGGEWRMRSYRSVGNHEPSGKRCR